MKRDLVAVVREPQCIGCTRCIDACPVDAIVGAQGQMHTVVEPWCIGCALCLPPCPVDCIDMLPAAGPWTAAHKRAAGDRARHRKTRLAEQSMVPERKDRRGIVARALARKRQR
jgi:electron transport complex protein RnfB